MPHPTTGTFRRRWAGAKAVEYVVASISVSEGPHNIVTIVLPVVVAETTIVSTLVGIKAKCVKA